MRHRFPTVNFSIKDDATFTGEYQGKIIQQNIDNAYRDYRSSPDSLAPILHRYASTAADVYASAVALSKDNIVPVIKSAGFVTDAEKMAGQAGGAKGFDAVFEPYNDNLVIVYAQDTKTGIEYFLPDDLKKAGIDKDSLRPMAIRNLIRLLPDIQIKGSKELYMVTAGGNYEASLLLMDDLWTKKNLAVDGDFIIGVPNRDLLLVTGSKDKVGIGKLRELVHRMYTTGNYPVSDALYKRGEGGGKLVVFNPDEGGR